MMNYLPKVKLLLHLAFKKANKAFSDVLKKITFADLVQKQNAKNGLVKFEDLAKSVIN